MKDIVFIMAHGAAQETFDRHVPFWDQHLNDRAPVVICPEDDPVSVPAGYDRRMIGKSGHSGEGAFDRLRSVLDFAEQDLGLWMHVYIYEYDSICLDLKSFVPTNGLCGNLHLNSDVRFLSSTYANPPWTIDSVSFTEILEASMRYPEMKQGGFYDRLISAWATVAGVPILNFTPPGYSQGTLCWSGRWELCKMVANGGTMVHGIKTKAQLETVLAIYEARDTLKKINDLPL